MSQPHVTRDATPAFFGSTVVFLAVTLLWNLITLWLLDISAWQRLTLGMGTVAAMFATMVLGKIVRDRAEAHDLVNEVRRARYEEMLAAAPAPGVEPL